MTPHERMLSAKNAKVSPRPVPLSIDVIVGLKNLLPEEERESAYIVLDKYAHAHLCANREVSQFYDPAQRITDLESGYQGVIIGMDMYSDAFRLTPGLPMESDHLYVMNAKGTVGHAVRLLVEALQ